MQLTWVSGPTGKVKIISITAKKVFVAAALSSVVMLGATGVLYLVGFKIAVEIRPELARSLGGVTSEAEQQRMESVYRDRLTNLQRALDTSAREIRQLQQLKNRFMEMATPAALRRETDTKSQGQGGPLLPEYRGGFAADQPLASSLDQAVNDFSQFGKAVKAIRGDWAAQLAWLQSLPTGVPVGGDFRISSGWGMRIDPFTGQLARHEGLDFTAAEGSHVLAAADGIVSRSGWEPSYGNIVEIHHAEGYLTRYAHTRQRHVTEGQRVRRGQWIADVGSTGRSTGPHLHYEVFRHGRVLNPAHVLPVSRI